LTAKTKKRIAISLGIGLALFPLHWVNQPLIDYIFLPQLGLVFMLGAITAYFMLNKKFDWRTLLGDKLVWIPMLVIVGSMVLQVAVHPGKQSAGVALLGISMFLTYLVSRDLGTSGQSGNVKLPITLVLIAVVLGGVITGIVAPGTQDGGIITNYCAAVGFLVFAGLLISRKWLWLALIPILLSALLIGSLEGVFVLGMMFLVVLIRRDWGKKLLVPVGLLVVAVVIVWVSGYIGTVYQNATKNLKAASAIIGEQEVDLDKLLTGRWTVIVDAVNDIRWLGHGFVLTPAPDTELGDASDRRPVHNTPLQVMDQIGPLAGIAWLWVSVYCLIKTRWKYIWAAVLVTSILDYYIWTQFALWWWVFAGLSTVAVDEHKDLIFRKACIP
jgi:hypothetical protein